MGEVFQFSESYRQKPAQPASATSPAQKGSELSEDTRISAYRGVFEAFMRELEHIIRQKRSRRGCAPDTCVARTRDVIAQSALILKVYRDNDDLRQQSHAFMVVKLIENLVQFFALCQVNADQDFGPMLDCYILECFQEQLRLASQPILATSPAS